MESKEECPITRAHEAIVAASIDQASLKKLIDRAGRAIERERDPEIPDPNRATIFQVAKVLLARMQADQVLSLLMSFDTQTRSTDYVCDFAPGAERFEVDLSHIQNPAQIPGQYRTIAEQIRPAIESDSNRRALILRLPQHIFPDPTLGTDATIEQQQQVREIMALFAFELSLALQFLGCENEEGIERIRRENEALKRQSNPLFNVGVPACMPSDQLLHYQEMMLRLQSHPLDAVEMAGFGPLQNSLSPRFSSEFTLSATIRSDMESSGPEIRDRIIERARLMFYNSELSRIGEPTHDTIEAAGTRYLELVNSRRLPINHYFFNQAILWIIPGEELDENTIRALAITNGIGFTEG